MWTEQEVRNAWERYVNAEIHKRWHKITGKRKRLFSVLYGGAKGYNGKNPPQGFISELKRGNNQMKLTLTFDINNNKRDISADFWNAHHNNWKDNENPTDLELKNSIKNEIDSWLEDLEIGFNMEEGIDKKIYYNNEIVKDILWEFVNYKDIPEIEKKLKEYENGKI